MIYEEIIDRIKNHGKINASDVTGVQIFMLIHDKIIKNITDSKGEYEFNFVPIDTEEEFCEINEKTCPDNDAFCRLSRQFVARAKDNLPIYVRMCGEDFELIIEVVETYE